MPIHTTRLELYALVLPLVCACNGTQPPAASPEPAPVSVAVAPEPDATSGEALVAVPDPNAEAPHQTGWFAPSPITALADEMVAINEAAIAGRALPPHRIDIEPLRTDSPDVSYRDESERPVGNLQYVVFGVEADIVFDRSATDPDDAGALRVVIFLSRAGWKLARVMARPAPTTMPVPRWLTGLEDVCWEVVRAAKERRLDQLLVGEAERAVLGNDALFDLIRQELPKRESLDLLADLVPDEGPSGLRVDDLVLVARDAKGELWGFEYDMDRKGGRTVLDSRPLVRASRFPGR